MLPFSTSTLEHLISSGVVSGSAYALVAVGFGLILRVTGRFHIAYSAVYALGAFVTYQAQSTFGFSFPYAILFAVGVGLVLSVAIEMMVYRPIVQRLHGGGDAALFPIFVASLGLSTAGESLINLKWRQPVTISTQVHIIRWADVTVTNLEVQSVVVAWIAVAIVVIVLRWSSLGRVIRAVQVNPDLSQDIGISPVRVRAVVFAIGGAIGGIGAAFLGARTAPLSDMGDTLVLYGVIAALLAGAVGSVVAMAALGLLMGLMESLRAFDVAPEWASPIIFGFLSIYIIVRALRLVSWKHLPRGRLNGPHVWKHDRDALHAGAGAGTEESGEA